MKGLNLYIGDEGSCSFYNTEADINSLDIKGQLLIDNAYVRSLSSVLFDEGARLVLKKTPSAYAIQDTSFVSSIVSLEQETLPIISYYNSPTNPYFIANYSMQDLLLSLRAVNGQLLDIKSISVIENEVVYLQELFPLLNSNTMYLLQYSENNKTKTVRVIY